MRAKLLQSCLTLCDAVDHSWPGSSAHGILQTRILEWVVMPFSRGSSWTRDQIHVSFDSCIGRQVLYHSHHLKSPTEYSQLLDVIQWIHMSVHLERAEMDCEVRHQGAPRCGEHIPSLHNRKCLWVCLRYLTVLDILLEEYTGKGSFWQVGWGLEWEEECHCIVYPLQSLRCACVILIIIMI